MSDSQPASLTDGSADSSLRERQLILQHAADQLILDKNTLATTLQFIVAETQQALNALRVDILFGYADGLRIEISSDNDEVGHFLPADSPIVDPAKPAPPASLLTSPLTLDGLTIGVISVEAVPGVRFGYPHLNFVDAAARLISIAITHAALFDEDNFREATDRLLVEATSGDSETVMRQVLEHILIALNSLTFVKPDTAEILFADAQDAGSLVVAYGTNSADIGIRVDVDHSVCGEAFRHGRTVLVQRMPERSDYRPLLAGMRCEMAIPIIFGSGHRLPIGVLNLESSRENAFSDAGRVLAERFVGQVVNAIAMTKIRADMDSVLQDELMVLAADQLLNSVHRINNSVGATRVIALELLEDLDSPDPLDPSELRQRLELIASEAETALAIPDELRRRIGTPRESADVNAQVRTGLAAVRIPDYIDLVTDLAAELPDTPCTALDLVVENLVLNAVTAMRDRPGTLRVATRLDQRRPREPFIVITVKDAGAGMTKDEIDHIFERRYPARRSGRGLGFGLVWVRSWVRRAQGLIEFESTPGSGTTVSIRFQVAPSMINWAARGGEPT